MLQKSDVCLCYLPIADVVTPSLALSLFAADLRKREISVTVDYANLYFARQLGLQEYMDICMAKYLSMYGEFIFRRAAYGESGDIDGFINEWLNRQRCYYFGKYKFDEGEIRYFPGDPIAMREKLLGFQEEACSFIKDTATRILDRQPKIVAISSMFQQINATIALAKCLKKQAPQLVIMIGGANCFDEAGSALLKFCPEIDYVFLGEADETFGPLCEEILKGNRLTGKDLPYGVIDRSAGETSGVHRMTMDLENLPYPDFTDYFQTINDVFDGKIRKKIIIEGSRGCWWGEKHPCTFCGLNSSAHCYRMKSAEYFASEVKYLLTKYPGIKECVLSDCILSNEHTKRLPELFDDLPYKVQFFSEIKSNVSRAELAKLRTAGFIAMQPGIESLNDHVLTLMNKGCRAIKQVEALKNYQELKIKMLWNLLCGFPGETEEDYEDLCRLIPKITHLIPPSGLLHIAFHRSSEYERNREKYGLILKPAGLYDYILPADDDLKKHLAYVFEPVDEDEQAAYYDEREMGESYVRLWNQIARWRASVVNGCADRLEMTIDQDGIEILDMRAGAKDLYCRLTGVKAEIYKLAEQVVSYRRLRELLPEVSESDLMSGLKELIDSDFLLNIGEEYLALAIKKQ